MKKNRLGIFLTYDPDGIVDEYIEYLLDDISPLFTKLIVVCNGFINSESRDILEKYTNSIFVRDNIGFDFQAWKETMFEYYGYSRVREYDELVLFNDSFFGPLFPFSHVFEEMDARKYDFWGLTVHGEAPTVKRMCPYGYRPRYIQTYFMVFNNKMLNDQEFINFWKSMPIYSNFQEVSEKCSAVLTKFFSDRGYRWGVFVDTTDLEEGREKNISQHAFNTHELIVNRRYPVIKRKSFVLGKKRFLQYNSGVDLPRALKYISDSNMYDTGLIFRHIIRRYDAAEIKESLNLSFVVNEDVRSKEWLYLFDKTVVCIHISKEASIVSLVKYATILEKSVYVCIYANKDIIEKIEALIPEKNLTNNIEVKEYSGTYIECLLHAINEWFDNYEYFAFSHDMEFNIDDASVACRTACEMMWDNLFFSTDYFGQLINKLKDNRYLGLLCPVPPMHGRYYTYCVNSKRDWNSYIQPWNAVLGNVIKPTHNSKIISTGCSFVCKMEAMRNLSHIEKTDDLEILASDESYNSAFDNLLPYIAQKNGYLSGWCINNEYAASEIENARYIVENTFVPDGPEFDGAYMSFPIINNVIVAYVRKLKKRKTEKKVVCKRVEIPVEKTVEVPVLVEIGLGRALKNYILKKIPFLKKLQKER